MLIEKCGFFFSHHISCTIYISLMIKIEKNICLRFFYTIDAFCLSLKACLSFSSSSSAICWKFLGFSFLLLPEDVSMPFSTLVLDSSDLFFLSGGVSSSYNAHG